MYTRKLHRDPQPDDFDTELRKRISLGSQSWERAIHGWQDEESCPAMQVNLPGEGVTSANSCLPGSGPFLMWPSPAKGWLLLRFRSTSCACSFSRYRLEKPKRHILGWHVLWLFTDVTAVGFTGNSLGFRSGRLRSKSRTSVMKSWENYGSFQTRSTDFQNMNIISRSLRGTRKYAQCLAFDSYFVDTIFSVLVVVK